MFLRILKFLSNVVIRQWKFQIKQNWLIDLVDKKLLLYKYICNN